jgi:DNA polymerase alpha subunit A
MDFSKLRKLRESNQKNRSVSNQAMIYEEVTNEEFNSYSKQVLLHDDFVVDDVNGEYTGICNWDERQSCSSDEEVEPIKKEKKKEFVKLAKVKRSREVETSQNEKDLLNDIFYQMDNDQEYQDKALKKVKVPKKEKNVGVKKGFLPNFSFNSNSINTSIDTSNTIDTDIINNNSIGINGMNTSITKDDNDVHVDIPREDYGVDIDDKDDYVDNTHSVFTSNIKINELKIRSLPSIKASQETKKFLPKCIQHEQEVGMFSIENANQKQWQDLKDTVKLVNEVPENTTKQCQVENNDQIFMYWIDAYELKGKVYLFGKVLIEGKYKSCCATIENINRNLFILPREYSRDDDGN